MDRREAAFTAADGTRIVYDMWTPPGDVHGVLVLCHGVGEHARRYDHVAARLGELGLVVYAPDHRGHGRSGGKRVLLREWSDYLDDLDALFAVAKREHPDAPLFLLGHSMGGAIALTYALDHQDELTALALSGPAVDVSIGTPKPLAALAKVLGRVVPGLPVTTLGGDVSRDPAVVAAYDADPLVHHGAIPAGVARGLLTATHDLPERLPSLHLPLLVQHGSADALVSVDGTRMIERYVGSDDVTIEIYDGLFHEVFNEPEKDEVLGDLVAWLRPRVPA
ncbi:alpha/beta hydrolase [Rhodococcus sp. HNM0569]|uniref:alpha/beta hydrolase n=1 Tax=Rhodococcus sp. HNM0569 TaxID=2716340 RepID=UPI00146B5CEC|nr:alpha/beta hydrolase [Rhodococcus sp. HNM0569]NLU84619.1 alpha/beta hydrolase [Rhodococcus sp. HNM0569]